MIKMTKSEEKEMKKSKQIIKKRKFWTLLWIFAPYLLEHWLEEMQQKGYCLYKINNRILFFSLYLIKCPSKQMKYAVDYQYKTNENYFKHHEECGWQLMYTPLIKNSGFAVWARESKENETPIEFYSDEQSKMNVAKRIIKMYFISLIATLCLSAIFVITASFSKGESVLSYIRDSALIFTALLILFFPILLFSYLGLKKRTQSNEKIIKKVFAKRIFLTNVFYFFVSLCVYIIITVIVSKSVSNNGVTEIILTSENEAIASMQITLLLVSIISFLAFLITIPYCLVSRIKSKNNLIKK